MFVYYFKQRKKKQAIFEVRIKIQAEKQRINIPDIAVGPLSGWSHAGLREFTHITFGPSTLQSSTGAGRVNGRILMARPSKHELSHMCIWDNKRLALFANIQLSSKAPREQTLSLFLLLFQRRVHEKENKFRFRAIAYHSTIQAPMFL